MPIMFNAILRGAGLALTEVRLIRHKDTRATRGHSPYELWRDNRPQFELSPRSQAPPGSALAGGSASFRRNYRWDNELWRLVEAEPPCSV